MLPKIDLVAAVLGLATSRQVSFLAQGPAVHVARGEKVELAGAMRPFRDTGTWFGGDFETAPAALELASRS